MAVSAIKSVSSMADFEAAVAGQSKDLLVAYFWASFHDACVPGGQMDQVLVLLGERYSAAEFVKVDAEAAGQAAEDFGVSMVPAFVFLRKGKRKVELVEGANPAAIQSALEKNLAASALSSSGGGSSGKPQASSVDSSSSTSSSGIDTERLVKLTKSSHIVLFMKGNAAEPKCKFSRAMVELLNAQGVRFASFDILSDNSVREGLKQLSGHPTYPQLYVAGKFIGGVDSVKALVEKDGGESLKAIILNNIAAPRYVAPVTSSAGPPQPQIDDAYLTTLVNKAQVVLFMKGNPDEPRCGFSRTIVKILQDEKIDFESFDILENEDVRAKLKVFADWPTYPQLWVKGKLVGGLDIVQEMLEEDEPLSETLEIESLNDRLARLVSQAPVMLFMKGNPDQPRCGFSRTMVGILQEESIKFDTFDILEDTAVRAGLKTYSNWPTFPQLYVGGKLIGGLDIVKELKEEDELQDALTPPPSSL